MVNRETALAIVLPAVPLGPQATRILAHSLFVAFIVLLGWSNFRPQLYADRM